MDDPTTTSRSTTLQPLLRQLAQPLTDQEMESVSGAGCKPVLTFKASNKEVSGDAGVKCSF